jgi:hypothetical protein
LYYNPYMSLRVLAALWRSALVTMRVLWRVMRQVFHEAIGAMFGIFAAWGAYAAWKQWKHGPILWVMGLAIVYAVTMAAFAVESFLRARRVR